ncbi:MAG: hypothetical protein BWY74_00828 [Firmicutes bacterium ADurb.Bin419]|nr:MAG: hypothetical protein BWY74_00828 [Firmicutes bacterium ADurb.Bin419]
MKIKSQVKYGKNTYLFEVDEKDEMETMHKTFVLANPPSKCNECGNVKDFHFDSNKDKEGNIYVNAVCDTCGAKAKLGRYKTGGFFWHQFEKWDKAYKQATEKDNQPLEDKEVIDVDDVDF